MTRRENRAALPPPSHTHTLLLLGDNKQAEPRRDRSIAHALGGTTHPNARANGARANQGGSGRVTQNSASRTSIQRCDQASWTRLSTSRSRSHRLLRFRFGGIPRSKSPPNEVTAKRSHRQTKSPPTKSPPSPPTKSPPFPRTGSVGVVVVLADGVVVQTTPRSAGGR